MPDLTHWVLVNILGPLMLPIFALATLCTIAGAKPEPIVSGFISLISSVIGSVLRLFIAILTALLRQPGAPRQYPPRRYPPRDPNPRS